MLLHARHNHAHTPIAAAISEGSGFSLPLCVGTVVGGAMFGDNLSFISDTTIAACNGQGCQMKDKFRTNFAVVVPAAVLTLAIILILSFNSDVAPIVSKDYNLIQILPYDAQILVALSALNTLGYKMTAFQIISYLFYPMLLLLSSLLFIFVIPEKKKKYKFLNE